MNDLSKYKNVYMIGIGGISMSGLAYILKSWNIHVSGSDIASSSITEKLENDGIKVNIGQIKENITNDIDLVVYTAAIKEENEELMEAKRLNINTVERGVFLGAITRLFKNTIGISGTHGKTTTTSMVSVCFLEANRDPSIQVGSILENINGNYRVGHSDTFIIEACEYCDSFLNFKQKSAIVLNIDNDHLDYFKNLDNIKKSFKQYVSNLDKDGVLVLNSDDKSTLELKDYTKANVLTYGFNNECNYKADNVSFNELGYGSFDLYKNNKFIDRINLSIVGKHNISNALACIALCDFYNIKIEDIKRGLLNYKGAKRRFEYKGIFKGAKVYDDYGHHPTEIKAICDAISNKKFNKSWVIFEPHTYSRFKEHKKDFAKSLINFDNIIITDIYAAREKNIYNVKEEDLIDEIKLLGKDSIHLNMNDIKNYIKDKVSDDDLILTLGAGNVTKLADVLVKED